MSRRFVDSQIGTKQRVGQGIFDLSNQFDLQQRGIWPNETSSTMWMRPKDWLKIPAVATNEQKAIGLIAVYPGTDSSFIAFSATVSSSGTYTVDWGDGTTNTYASGALASKIFDYSTILESTLTSKGYKQTLVTITPQSERNLLTINFSQKYPFSNAISVLYSTGLLELFVNAEQLTTLQIRQSTTGSDTGVYHNSLEKIAIKNNRITNASYLFSQLSSLKSVEMNSSIVTNMSYMFYNCIIMRNAPQLDTFNVTNMNYMFSGANALNNVPFYDTSNVTNMSRMFENCDTLETIPKFNTINVTDMSYMFYICRGLKTVPLLNTLNVTNMQYMFGFASSTAGNLKTIPLLNTSKVTNMAQMFRNRQSLETLPLLDMGRVTDLTEFVYNCLSINYLPNFDVSNVRDLSSAFAYLNTLPIMPELDVSSAYSINSGFIGYSSIKWNIYGARYSDIYLNSASISATEINNFLNNLGPCAVAGYQNTTTSFPVTRTIAIYNSYAAGTIYSKTATIVGGTNVITVSNNVSNVITAGMEMTYDNSNRYLGAVTAELKTNTDTVYRPNHGLSNGSLVSFSNIVTATGPDDIKKMWIGYYVANNYGNFGSTSVETQNIVYANGIWAMASSSGIWTTSTPHLTNSWTRVLTGSFNSIEYGDGYWVAGASSIIYYTSQPDASTGWVSVTSNGISSYTITTVKYLNGYWIALGSSGRYWYTAINPTGDWTQVYLSTYASYQFKSIEWNGTYFVMCTNSYSGTTYVLYKTSNPGGTWTATDYTLNYDMKKVKWTNNCWVLLSDNRLYYKASSDPSGRWDFVSYLDINQVFNYNLESDGTYWALASANGMVWIKPVGSLGTPPSAGNWIRVHMGWNYYSNNNAIQFSNAGLYYNANAPYKWFTAAQSMSAGTFNGSGVEVYKPYYVINKTDNDFQLSETLGGTVPINILQDSIPNTTGTNGCGMLQIPTVLSATVTNPGTITLSLPASGSGTVTSQTAYFASPSPKRSIARLKGWQVTG